MNNFLFTVAVVGSSLLAGNTASAAGPHVSHTKHISGVSHSSHVRGHNSYRWSYRCYSPRLGCYCFYCSDDSCWYYWDAPSNVYRPVVLGVGQPIGTLPQSAGPVQTDLATLPAPPANLPGPDGSTR
jgi:hypothetical protein